MSDSKIERWNRLVEAVSDNADDLQAAIEEMEQVAVDVPKEIARLEEEIVQYKAIAAINFTGEGLDSATPCEIAALCRGYAVKVSK